MAETPHNPDFFSPSAVTARIVKGGALLPDMRAMAALWNEGMEKGNPLPEIARALPKATMSRVKDTYTRVFRRRRAPNSIRYAPSTTGSRHGPSPRSTDS